MATYQTSKTLFIWFIIVSLICVGIAVYFDIQEQSLSTGAENYWLGVETIELNASIIKLYDIHTTKGLLVSRVFLGSPAEMAGIKKGDIIRRWDGVSVTDQYQFKKLMDAKVITKSSKVVLNRNGQSVIVRVQLQQRPGTF